MCDQPKQSIKAVLKPTTPSSASDTKEALINNKYITSARNLIDHPCTAISSGFDQLDRYLPSNGWPIGSMIEVLSGATNASDLWVALPILKNFNADDSWSALINPPYIPYAPTLTNFGIDLNKILIVNPPNPNDIFWTAEEAIKSDTCSVVLVWISHYNRKALRRLQLSTQQYQRICFCFHPSPNTQQHTTTAIRLSIRPNKTGICIDLLKCRGGTVRSGININFNDIGYS